MDIICHEISRSSCVAPEATPNIDEDLLSPRESRKRSSKIGKGEKNSVKDDGAQYRERWKVTKDDWEEQHWNKTRELREVRASRSITVFVQNTTLRSCFVAMPKTLTSIGQIGEKTDL